MKKYQFHLPLLLLVLSLTGIKLLISPPADQKYFSPELPKRLRTAQTVFDHQNSLPAEASTSNAALQTSYPQAKYHQVIVHQQYRPAPSQTSLIEISLAYVVRTDGDWHTFLKEADLSSPANPEKILDQVTAKGYYRLWQQQEKTHLYSCINVNGSATVTARQFRNEQYDITLQGPHLLSWLLGQAYLKEDSCLWIHLISRRTYPSLSKAAEHIEPMWLEIVEQLSSN